MEVDDEGGCGRYYLNSEEIKWNYYGWKYISFGQELENDRMFGESLVRVKSEFFCLWRIRMDDRDVSLIGQLQ